MTRITTEDIKKLADLSRIELSAEEMASLPGQFEGILGYVDQIQKAVAGGSGKAEVGDLHNVMCEDTNPHESGIHTEAILANAPMREGNYLKVKKIL
jgi:aspartyl-tRNA(Asn)/glutamyl-tRNA(Gln) amidotransferase subunit C